MFLPMVVNIEPISRNRMNRRDIFFIDGMLRPTLFFLLGNE